LVKVELVVNPVISVVIPTRNRPDTLAVCLRAMRHHASAKIEIVVQDNSTGPETQTVVKAAAVHDRRIVYSQAPFPTSQRHNFELGLAAAKGQYLSIIGDDDGYSIGSLDWLVERLQTTPVDAVRWNLLNYVWPSLSEDDEGFMDLYHATCFGGFSIEPGADLARKVLHAETMGSWDNILVYHGMISRDVYERMKSKTDGVFFAYPMPDVYAHNVIPFFCDKYLQVNEIVSIYGVSCHSAGASWAKSISNSDKAAREGNRWMAESVEDEVAKNLPWQPDIRTLRYHDFAALKVAEAHGMLGGREVDAGIWTQAILNELSMNHAQLGAWLSAKPKGPFDQQLISAVKKKFRRKSNPAPAVVSNKKAANEQLPSLRIRAVEKAFPDDVEGAMLALSRLLGPQTTRFGNLPKAETGRAATLINAAAMGAWRFAPRLTSQILNSRLMPTRVWRYLKMMRWVNNKHSYGTHLIITELQGKYRENTKK
jgi:glycosyltransferase involved in cell wall biosynthesis